MQNVAAQFSQTINGMQLNFLFALQLLGILWAVHVLNLLSGYRLNILGITPRRIYGIPGIFFSTFLHGNFTHIFFNSIPFVVLTDLILIEGHAVYFNISLEIIILSGSLVWLFGGRGTHVGASTLIMGYFGYILSKAYFNVTASTLIVAGLCLYYFGSLFLSLFPSVKKNISWEGHVFGFLSGIFVTFYGNFLPLWISHW
jgi:membrane associated rhomboid family serine protease